jgi:hypothetical protein
MLAQIYIMIAYRWNKIQNENFTYLHDIISTTVLAAECISLHKLFQDWTHEGLPGGTVSPS